jgi:hypothetical protein
MKKFLYIILLIILLASCSPSNLPPNVSTFERFKFIDQCVPLYKEARTHSDSMTVHTLRIGTTDAISSIWNSTTCFHVLQKIQPYKLEIYNIVSELQHIEN